MRLVNYEAEGMTTRNRKASLAERYRIMCRYYGALPTQMRHLWFATRFLWAKVSGNKAERERSSEKGLGHSFRKTITQRYGPTPRGKENRA